MSSNRPTKFEHFRFMGDKRTQLVYDLDSWSDIAITTEIADSGVGLTTWNKSSRTVVSVNTYQAYSLGLAL